MKHTIIIFIIIFIMIIFIMIIIIIIITYECVLCVCIVGLDSNKCKLHIFFSVLNNRCRRWKTQTNFCSINKDIQMKTKSTDKMLTANSYKGDN